MRPTAVKPFLPKLQRKLGLGLALTLSGAPGLFAQEPLPTHLPTESPRTVAYEMDVALAEDGHTISGQLKVTWVNQTSSPTDELYWHVYNNAWEGPQSAWLTEARMKGDDTMPREFGHTEVEWAHFLGITNPEGEVIGEGNLDLDFEYLPQPGAPLDRTVARVKLPRKVLPQHAVTVELHFTATMPRAFRRSGFGGEGYLHAVQWFPKLGVFEKVGGETSWNCPPYRYLVEFYADYGSYKVNLTLPARYENHFVTSGSILGTGAAHNESGTITYFTEAQDIHDYAWTVDPEARVIEREFRAEMYRDEEEEQKVARALGRSVEMVRPSPTKMILMLQPEHADLEERYFDALGKAIYYFGLWYGSYPYPTISCVDPANDARATGGMEYPRLITGGASLGVAETTLRPQGVTVHEFGHQFWYGLVGNDEFRHAWMDEGFNTFSTKRIMNKAFPAQLDTYSVFGTEYVGHAPLPMPSYESGDSRGFLSLEQWESPDLGFVPDVSLALRKHDSLGRFLAELPPVTYFPKVSHDSVLDEREKFRVAWGQPLQHPTMDLQDTMQRRINAYYRPALTLETMARLMGEERWTRVLRAYHERFRFQHPQPEDFLRTVQEFGHGASLKGENQSVTMDWANFWEHAYVGNAPMDFKVHHLTSIPSMQTGQTSGAPQFDVEIGITRSTDFAVPVEVRVTWEDGSATDLVWAGNDWVWTYQWSKHPMPAAKVEIDPRRRLLLDRDWSNNTFTREPHSENAWHVGVQTMLWAQQVLQYFGGVG
ncbi:MAG: M1 family metallopeptidase [Planctomycetota bacterium]|nr:M1 family metallopeptidase [Planctomycetota bacterium]MDA1113492.1 M1 family metallopeptidase [Planctomycetota bacterium]